MTERPRIAVAHPNLMAKGGAEGVSIGVLEALQNQYEVTLLTLVDPDFDELNEYYSASVDSTRIAVDQPGILTSTLYRHTDSFHLLKSAFLSRLVKRERHRFEVVLSTYNEFSFRTSSVQYIHMPQFGRWVDAGNRAGLPRRVYDRLCQVVEGFAPDDIRSNCLLANSGWTADVTEDVYGVRPSVVYPPVDTSEFVAEPWADREEGFVTIGRLTPSKNCLRTIEIIRRLRGRGHQVHLHIVGPTLDTDYAERVAEVAATHDFVHLEGEVSREALVDMVCSHRYGVHGMDHEHFGMAVAELAAGGTIPFVPDGGGQREIVHEREDLLYGTTEEAVERIDRVLSDTALQSELRGELSDVENRFGRERFKRAIREIVKEVIDASPSRAPVGVSECDKTT